MSWALGIPLGGPDPQSYLRLLLRLTPDGYSQDPDGPRVTELEAYATALWVGRVALDRAFAQAYPDQATELLEEWERAYDLPNDAARTLEERQQRVRAAELAIAGAGRPHIEAALQEAAPLASLVANARTEVEAAAALSDMIFHIGVRLDVSEFESPSVRRALARVLRRMLPARLHPTPGFLPTNAARAALDGESQLYVTEGATWGGAQVLGRTVLDRQDASTRAVREPTTRFREYAGLVRLEAADLNALQDLTLMAPCSGGAVVDEYPSSGVDCAIIHLAAFAAASVEVLVDDSIDWRDRYVLTSIRYSSSDIRPGQPNDTLSAIGFRTRMWATLDGDTTALGGDRLTFDTDRHLYADAATGALKLYAATTDTAIQGVCIVSPDLGTR